MKHVTLLLGWLALIIATQTEPVWAEPETIDLKSLAAKARPAVMQLVVSDAAGNEIATATGFLVSADGKLVTNHHAIDKAASAVAKAKTGVGSPLGMSFQQALAAVGLGGAWVPEPVGVVGILVAWSLKRPRRAGAQPGAAAKSV